jgi:predicted Zn-dependent protease
MGLAGVILGLGFYGQGPLRKRIYDWVGRALLRGVIATFALGLVIWLVLPVVDNAAHLGGFVAGLALAALFRNPNQPAHRHTRGWTGVCIALTGLSWGTMAADGGQAVQAMHTQRAEQCEAELASVDAHPIEVSYLLACAVESWHSAGQAERAEAATRRLMVVGSEVPDVLQYAGSLLIETDASHEALLLLTAWHERAPSLASANALAWHLLTAHDPAHRDPERALALLQAFPIPPSTDPFETALVQDTLAQALFQVGRTHEAIPLQEQALRTCFETPISWLQPGELWRMRQRLKTMRRAQDAGR